MSELEEPGNDQFILVMLMRLYDVQMALLETANPAFHRTVEDWHEQGRIIYDEVKYVPDPADSE